MSLFRKTIGKVRCAYCNVRQSEDNETCVSCGATLPEPEPIKKPVYQKKEVVIPDVEDHPEPSESAAQPASETETELSDAVASKIGIGFYFLLAVLAWPSAPVQMTFFIIIGLLVLAGTHNWKT